jgi:phosphoribosylamine--glycine ligase
MALTALVVGSGGREHALAWKLAQSPRVARLWVIPGNGGTPPAPDPTLHPPATTATPDLLDFARRAAVDLTIVGPEAPLVDGLVDAFQAAGLRCFGPTRQAARLEGSKAFAKAFMERHGIPTGRYVVVPDYAKAVEYVRRVDYPVVIKASGLAAGKGVIVPADRAEAEAALRQMMVERVFGAAGDEVVIEERLYGQEASVLAFCDGRTVAVMPPAQDHKAIFDGDRGPNTGGMGAYAPARIVTPALLEETTRLVLQRAVDGLAAEGAPYVGVLYAGLMLTAAGVRVLEFNCRFGDPETQAILPLLETDLVEIVEACLEGALDRVQVRWRPGAAAAVVAAAAGYPGSYQRGLPITGVEAANALPGVIVFHAGTRRAADGRLLTDGGRVLAVTGVGDDLRQAIDRAYAGMARIHFEGMHYRRDIGAKGLGGQPAGFT